MRYTREECCLAWLSSCGIHPKRLRQIIDELDGAEAVYDWFMVEGKGFLECFARGSEIELLIDGAQRDNMHEMTQMLHAINAHVMYIDDSIYPASLRRIPSPPPILYYCGDPDCIRDRQVTMVGTRRPSVHGIEATRRIARDLAQQGIPIVSGLAGGLDTEAHLGCMEGGAPTIGVLAAGIDVNYPSGSRQLKEDIVRKGGLLLTEMPLGSAATKGVFHRRNRILSGLSPATLMMEGAAASGSMITVRHAQEQGRRVFAYPGLPGAEASEGAHALLRQGAAYCTSAQDVLEEMGWTASAGRIAPLPAARMLRQDTVQLDDDAQRKVYQLLANGEKSFDEILAASGLSLPDCTLALTMLQLNGLVSSLPGKLYTRAKN